MTLGRNLGEFVRYFPYEMELITNDMLKHGVTKFLNIGDIWKLSLCSKNIRKCVNGQIYKMFVKRFTEKKFYMPIIIKHLKQERANNKLACISGSTILQILYGENWDSDVDIFIDSDEDIQIDKMEIENLRKETKVDRYFDDIENFTRFYDDSFDDSNSNYKVVEIVKKKGKFDNFDQLLKFDLEICSCWFDGNTLCIKNPENTFNKISELGPAELYHADLYNYRFEKYHERGIIIKDYKPSLTQQYFVRYFGGYQYSDDNNNEYDLEWIQTQEWESVDTNKNRYEQVLSDKGIWEQTRQNEICFKYVGIDGTSLTDYIVDIDGYPQYIADEADKVVKPIWHHGDYFSDKWGKYKLYWAKQQWKLIDSYGYENTWNHHLNKSEQHFHFTF